MSFLPYFQQEELELECLTAFRHPFQHCSCFDRKAFLHLSSSLVDNNATFPYHAVFGWPQVQYVFAASNHAPYCIHIRCYKIMQLAFIEEAWSEVQYLFCRCHRGSTTGATVSFTTVPKGNCLSCSSRHVRYELLSNDGLANLLRVRLMCTSIPLRVSAPTFLSIPKRSERHVMSSLQPPDNPLCNFSLLYCANFQIWLHFFQIWLHFAIMPP